MSDTAVSQDVVLDIPDETPAGRFTPRKTLYRAGEVNEFVFTEDGEERTGYLTFSSARLISLSAREQVARRRVDFKEVSYRALVATMGIIIDDPEIGVIDDDGNQVPHPLHREPRYARWQNSKRPFRVNGQQWVQPENAGLLWRLLRHLQENKGFAVRINPPNPEGSQRSTQDKVRARPAGARSQMDDPSNYGAHLDAFEVSVNPNYEQGFKSFVQGLDEQMERIENVFSDKVSQEEQETLKEQLRQNVHFLGGAYWDNTQSRWWARPVDVGMLTVDDNDFALYQQYGPELTDERYEELFGHLSSPVHAGNEEEGGALAVSDDEAYDF